MDFRSLDLNALAQSGRLTAAELKLASLIAGRQAYYARDFFQQDTTDTAANAALVEQIFSAAGPMSPKEQLAHLQTMHTRGELDERQLRKAQVKVMMDGVSADAYQDDPMLALSDTFTAIPPQDPVERLDWEYLLELNQTYMLKRRLVRANPDQVGDRSLPSRAIIVIGCIIAVGTMVLGYQVFDLIIQLLEFNKATPVSRAVRLLIIVLMALPSLVFLYRAYRERQLLAAYKQFQQTYQEQRAELVKKQRFDGF